MGVPLNIDWQQILLHLLNFTILAGGLYLLLYKPVKDFMEKRNAYYLEMDGAANAKLAKVNAMELEYQARLDNAEIEIRKRRITAAADAEKAAALQLEEAKKHGEKLLLDYQTTAIREHDKIIRNAEKEITQMAIAATEKLLAQSSTGSLDEFLNSISQEHAHD